MLIQTLYTQQDTLENKDVSSPLDKPGPFLLIPLVSMTFILRPCPGWYDHPPGTIPFNRTACHTSTTTSFFNLSQSAPSQTGLHVTLPPFLADTGDQTFSLKKQFQEYAYETLPNAVGFQGTARGRSFSTDASSLDGLASHRTGNLDDFTSGTFRSNGESIQYAAYSPRPFKTEPLHVFDPSYVPIGNDVSSTSDIIRQWPSSIAVASNISATHCCAPQMTSYGNVGSLGKSTSVQCHYNNSRCNDINPPTVPSGSRPRRRCLKQEPCLSDTDSSDFSSSHLLGLKKPCPSDIDSADFSDTRLLFPKEPLLDDVDSLEPATPCHPIKNEPNLEEPEPSNTSVINDVDLFNNFTCQNDDPSDECQVSGFGAPKPPNVSPRHTPETLEPCVAQHNASQPVGDADFEERLQPQGTECQQTTSNILSAASEPHKQEKKPRKKKEKKLEIEKEKEQRTTANPNRIRKSYSSIRRHNPRMIYWCANATCKASQSRGFRGFRTTEDTRRHLAMHKPSKVLCKLAHKNGSRYEGRRSDHLREHIRHVHKDRSVDEPEIKEMIESQRFKLPELREGVNVIAVQMPY